MEERIKITEEFNKQFKADVFIACDDGEIISYNENWIGDSEYMNYVYDNHPSSRISEFIKRNYKI
tara:strand:- start:1199 stop:1393 length:195 start_codon:yes stop_codon:yes gene_type:complete